MHWLIRGFTLLRAPLVRRWVIIPMLMNVVLFGGLIALSILGFAYVERSFQSWLPSWLEWLAWLLWPCFLVLLAVVATWSFAMVANILASPFNGILSEHVQLHLTGVRPRAAVGMDIVRSIWRQLQFVLYAAPRAVLTLLLFVVPGVQVAAPAVWFLLNAWLSLVQYSDYASDNNRQTFGDLLRDLRRRRWDALPFGLVVAAAMLVPVVNLFVMPAAVAGATALWLDQHEDASTGPFEGARRTDSA